MECANLLGVPANRENGSGGLMVVKDATVDLKRIQNVFIKMNRDILPEGIEDYFC
jgi:hypothetical protein